MNKRQKKKYKRTHITLIDTKTGKAKTIPQKEFKYAYRRAIR